MPDLENSEVTLRCWKMYGGNHGAHHAVSLPGLQGVLYSAPCGAPAGGDLYYLSACGSGVTARACLADATGHGERSAEVGAWFEEIFGRHIHRMSPSVVLRDVNARAAVLGDFQAVATAFCISYNALNGQLRFSNAGHPPPLLHRKATDTVSPLDVRGEDRGARNLPLGVKDACQYNVGAERLAPGDRLLLYTDGVSEAPDASGMHLGHERLQEAFAATVHLDAVEQGSQLVDRIAQHTGAVGSHHDDMTLLLFEVLPYMSGNRFYHLVRNNLFKNGR